MEDKNEKQAGTEFRCASKGDPDIFAYPDFGVYLYRSENLFLSIRCGPVGQNGNGGHAHNDQLGLEMIIGERAIALDPGTYIYTALPERRNQFRATSAHFTPQCNGKEQNSWTAGKKGLFRLRDNAGARCLYFGKDGFVGAHHGFGRTIYRVVLILKEGIAIRDYGADACGPINNEGLSYSNGYGKLVRS